MRRKKDFRILTTKKNDGTIKRRLVSDTLPCVPLEAPEDVYVPEDVYEKNAKRYEIMNKTKAISRVLREDETITNMEQLLDATEDRQNPYHETSGE